MTVTVDPSRTRNCIGSFRVSIISTSTSIKTDSPGFTRDELFFNLWSGVNGLFVVALTLCASPLPQLSRRTTNAEGEDVRGITEATVGFHRGCFLITKPVIALTPVKNTTKPCNRYPIQDKSFTIRSFS